MDGEPGEIYSGHLLQVMRAIDELWSSLEAETVPKWFTEEAVIYLDLPVRDHLKLRSVVSKSTESVPSEVDPPRNSAAVFLMISAAVGIAMPVAIGLHQLVSTSEPAIIFTLAVMAIALTYGAQAAVLASVISMVVYNFSFVEPIMHFTVPGAEELSYTAINIFISLLLPWLFGVRRIVTHKVVSESGRTRDIALPYL